MPKMDYPWSLYIVRIISEYIIAILLMTQITAYVPGAVGGLGGGLELGAKRSK